MKYNHKLTIAYDGTNYSGWQVQDNASAIQPLIEQNVRLFTREHVKLIGSGRTDAGVHALGQVAHFNSENEHNLYRMRRALNGMLPPGIRVISCDRAPESFHAQYSAIGKTYHYNLYLDEVMDPFQRLYCWHIKGKFNLELLRTASAYFIGNHDFTSFANQSDEGSAAKNPVRTIKNLLIIPIKGGIRLEFEGDGFLYKMVRNITGTLVEVAQGKRDPDSIPNLLKVRDRKKVGMAAPPQGLFLVDVHYPPL